MSALTRNNCSSGITPSSSLHPVPMHCGPFPSSARWVVSLFQVIKAPAVTCFNILCKSSPLLPSCKPLPYPCTSWSPRSIFLYKQIFLPTPHIGSVFAHRILTQWSGQSSALGSFARRSLSLLCEMLIFAPAASQTSMSSSISKLLTSPKGFYILFAGAGIQVYLFNFP